MPRAHTDGIWSIQMDIQRSGEQPRCCAYHGNRVNQVCIKQMVLLKDVTMLYKKIHVFSYSRLDFQVVFGYLRRPMLQLPITSLWTKILERVHGTVSLENISRPTRFLLEPLFGICMLQPKGPHPPSQLPRPLMESSWDIGHGQVANSLVSTWWQTLMIL